MQGGYDFVDVRDVAEGIISCTENGKSGESYILSGRYITIKEMFDILAKVLGKRKEYKAIPLGMIRWAAPMCEKLEKAFGNPLLITPYSLYALESNGNFSHEKAEKELGYSVRPIEETLADMVVWLHKEQ